MNRSEKITEAIDWRDEGADVLARWEAWERDPTSGEGLGHSTGLIRALAAALREAREREVALGSERNAIAKLLSESEVECSQLKRERESMRPRSPDESPEDGTTVLAQWSDGGPVQPLDYADRFGRLAWWLGSIEVEPPARWWPLPPGAR